MVLQGIWLIVCMWIFSTLGNQKFNWTYIYTRGILKAVSTTAESNSYVCVCYESINQSFLK